MTSLGCSGAILPRSMREKTEGLLRQDLSARILGAFYRVYNELRSGFVEAVYEHALTKELRHEGLKADRFEVGLLLNFGPEPNFKRLVFSNTRKPNVTTTLRLDPRSSACFRVHPRS